jgi:chromosome segregation ATPase
LLPPWRGVQAERDEATKSVGAREKQIEELRARLTQVTAQAAQESGLAEEFNKLQGERTDALERLKLVETQLDHREDALAEFQRRIGQLETAREELMRELDRARNPDTSSMQADWDQEYQETVKAHPEFSVAFDKLATELINGMEVGGHSLAFAVAHDLVEPVGDAPGWRLTQKGRRFARHAVSIDGGLPF